MLTITSFEELLGLHRRPVAVKFQESAPEGIARINETAASGCVYWKLAAEGRTFYTESADHFGCPIGAHTHGIALPDETASELEDLVSTMVDLQYISMGGSSEIPQLTGDFGVAIYAPPFRGDVPARCGSSFWNAKQMMFLARGAHAAGVSATHR